MTFVIQAVPTLQWASHEVNERSNPITMLTDTEYRSLNTICVHIT